MWLQALQAALVNSPFSMPPPPPPIATVNHTSFLSLSISILILTVLPKMGHFAETDAGVFPGFASESALLKIAWLQILN